MAANLPTVALAWQHMGSFNVGDRVEDRRKPNDCGSVVQILSVDPGGETLYAIDWDNHPGVGQSPELALQRCGGGEPKIEAELRSAGRAYLESKGANRDEIQPLVREASKLGLPAEAIAHVTGVPGNVIAYLIADDDSASDP